MLINTVERLKRDYLWKYFIEFFEAQQNELVTELQAGSVKDITRLEVINSQLQLWERLKGLEEWASKYKSKPK